MQESNERLVRSAFEAFANGDLPTLLDFIDPDIEWTYLDPSEEEPSPRICRGRDEFTFWVTRAGGRHAESELEEVTEHGERFVVVFHSPGIDAQRARRADDRTFHVVTVRGGRITALRACRSRDEAQSIATGA